MKLENLIPQESSFYLRSYDEEFRLRPVTLADEIWCKTTFKNVGLELDMNLLCQYVYRLIVDKTSFKKRIVDVIDEEGNEVPLSIGGFTLLMSMISGEDDKIGVVEAFNKALGVCEQKPEDDDEDEDGKKKVTKK